MSWLSKMFTSPVEPPPHGSLATTSPTTPGGAISPTPDGRTDAALTSSRLRTEVAALTRTKFREGYAIADVDAFVERVAVALEERARGYRPGLTPDDVQQARFASTKFQEGYAQDEVDELLDRVVRTLT